MIESYNIKMMKNDYLENILGAFTTALTSNIESEVSNLGGRSLNHETALVAIYNHPDEGIDKLSKVLGLTHSGAVRLVGTLINEGLLVRRQNPNDARAAVLCVTEAGQQRVQKILQARAQTIESVVASLSDQQKEQLLPIIELALSSITKNETEARRICRLCNEGVCKSIGCPVESVLP
jgi:DNA-binding MarR family transcriptional regulator